MSGRARTTTAASAKARPTAMTSSAASTDLDLPVRTVGDDPGPRSAWASAARSAGLGGGSGGAGGSRDGASVMDHLGRLGTLRQRATASTGSQRERAVVTPGQE